MNSKSIAIIGASGVIGTAVATLLASQGHRLGLHYCSNREPLESIPTSISERGPHIVHQSSLSTFDEGRSTVSYFQKQLGRLDGLALCAGRVPWKNEDELTADDWNDATFELTSQPYNMAFHFCQICNPKSRIVGLSSISAKYGGSTSSRHYGAAKAALESSLLGLSRSLYGKEICINIVRAGFILTPQQTRGRSKLEITERIMKIPFQRAGRPEEIADLFSFFFGHNASFITGQCISVAGGD